MKHDKGASFVYKQLINRRANTEGLMVAPAYFTWSNTINHGMSQNEWFCSLDNISKIYITKGKVELYTNIHEKNMDATEGQKSYGHSATCLNCSHHEADTMHIYVMCTVAHRVWNRIEKILRMLNKLDVRKSLTPQQILFHKGITDHVMIGLLIAGKYMLTLLM
jgi:hypothetical protein